MLDYAAGSGYYTEILSRGSSSEGLILSHRLDPSRIAEGRLERVSVLQDLDEIEPRSLDLVLIALAYHDLVNLDLERHSLLEQLRNALRPGGRIVVIDHAAAADSGGAAVATLHRIDEAFVRDEMSAGGFELVATSPLLRNPADPRTASIFDPAVRADPGGTDRFLLVFEERGTEGVQIRGSD